MGCAVVERPGRLVFLAGQVAFAEPPGAPPGRTALKGGEDGAKGSDADG